MTAAAPARLKRRAAFLAAARGQRAHHGLFTIQAGRRPADEAATDDAAAKDRRRDPRIGLTVTRKVGSAPERNRIRRRLREALRHAKALSTEPETDYVVVARRDVLSVPFPRLIADLEATIRRVGAKMRQPRAPVSAARRPDER